VTLIIDIASWILILAGSFFVIVGALGLVRMPEIFTRMHAASIIDTLKGGTATATQGDLNHPFFSHQFKVVREHSGKLDPESIEEYIAVGGYRSLFPTCAN
jgi:hypothetical protein